jgi:hypothetical protein
MPTPPTYRERLRIEGLVLAGSGVLGSVLLLALTTESRRWPLNTIGQLVVVVALLAFFGPRATAKALRSARGMRREALGSGEPTPLWQLPLIVAALTVLVAKPVGPIPDFLSVRAGWDAGLRVTGGCALVGLAQAFLLERQVAQAEQSEGHVYHRVAGSRLGRGTNLGYAEPELK